MSTSKNLIIVSQQIALGQFLWFQLQLLYSTVSLTYPLRLLNVSMSKGKFMLFLFQIVHISEIATTVHSLGAIPKNGIILNASYSVTQQQSTDPTDFISLVSCKSIHFYSSQSSPYSSKLSEPLYNKCCYNWFTYVHSGSIPNHSPHGNQSFLCEM